jgi:putative protease
MPNSQKPELLAPAGSFDAACAALHYGADAVYLGLRSFSARAEAENFSPDELSEIVGYAHGLTPRRRVYVTLNTLMKDAEIPSLLDPLLMIEGVGVDAVIVQDAGVLRLVREHFPGLRIHASTQMAICSADGARAAKAWGCSRVVLARELALEDIRDIAATGGVEVEVFVHGALCYGYSGLCLFSSLTSGRSGNRGRCAYCCRSLFKPSAVAGEAWRLPFSMKDLALARDLSSLQDAGVTSLKIEGRMKSALYVGAVVDYYRRRLDGRLSAADATAAEADIQTIFSRPWTRLHLDPDSEEPVIDSGIVGHRGTPIGVVDGVRRDRQGRIWLQFRTSRGLEKHDGIQVDLPGEAKPYGFAVDTIQPAPKRGQQQPPQPQISVPAGTDVEVLLPADAPQIPTRAPVYCASSQAVKRRFRYDAPRPGVWRVRRPVRVTAQIGASEVSLHARATGMDGVEASVKVTGEFGTARQPGKTEEAFRKAFERMGETEWSLESLDIQDPDGRFVPASLLNDARRSLADELSGALQRARGLRSSMVTAAVEAVRFNDPQPTGLARGWSLKIRSAAQVSAFEDDDWSDVCEVVIAPASPLDEPSMVQEVGLIRERIGARQVRVALPTILRRVERDSWRLGLLRLVKKGVVGAWEVSNPGGWGLLQTTGLLGDGADVSSDWPLYSLNRLAIRHWLDVGISQVVLSPEDERGNIRQLLRLAGARVLPLMFQYVPLFISENAPPLGGGHASSEDVLVEGKSGDSYMVQDLDRRTVVTAASPLSLAGRLVELQDAGATRFRADFIHDPSVPDAVLSVWRGLRKGKVPPRSHEGNYLRGLA